MTFINKDSVKCVGLYKSTHTHLGFVIFMFLHTQDTRYMCVLCRQ